MRVNRPLLLCSFMAALCLTGCDNTPEPSTAPPTPEEQAPSDPHSERLSEHIWRQSTEQFQQTVSLAVTLQQSIHLLLDEPTQDHLNAAQKSWHDAHNQLLKSASIFAIGKISPGLFKQLQHSYFAIDAHPIQPGYLDYFDVYQHSGIVNDITVNLSADNIRQQHGFSTDEDIALGFHAIAYLLWGEEQKRPASDFQEPNQLTAVQQQNGLRTVDLPEHRRRQLLTLQMSLLLDDLHALDYKLSHHASGIVSAYHSLQPQSRLQLWQQAHTHLLRTLLQLPYLNKETGTDQDDAEQTVTAAELPSHNLYAKGQMDALIATLQGINEGLFSEAKTSQAGSDKEITTVASKMYHEHASALEDALNKALEEAQALNRKKMRPLLKHKQLLKRRIQKVSQLVSPQTTTLEPSG